MQSYQKQGIFSFESDFSYTKTTQIFLKKNSLKNLKLEEQLLVKWLSILIFCIKVYLVKIGLIFDSSASSSLTRYQQILSVCSFGCKNVLNSTCHPMIFHNRHRTNGQVVPFLKLPISHCLEPGGHGDGSTFRAQKPQLEIPGL